MYLEVPNSPKKEVGFPVPLSGTSLIDKWNCVFFFAANLMISSE